MVIQHNLQANRQLSKLKSGFRISESVSLLNRAVCCCPCRNSAQGGGPTLRSHTASALLPVGQHCLGQTTMIVDADVAEEMVAYTRNNILQQAGQAMLAQANQTPMGVLSLLR